MKKAILLLALVLAAPSLFAQEWRDRPYARSRDNSFEITPFGGYRWGGTIPADQTNLYGVDADLDSSGHYGVNFGIPIAPNGMKLELMVNRQDTRVGTRSTLFGPIDTFGNFHVTYYHAGLLFPFNESRAATPYAIVSAGVANLDPAEPGVSASNKFSASAGVGVKLPVTPNVGIRLEGRGYVTPLRNDNCSHCYFSDYYGNNHDLYQGEVNVGLIVKF